MKKVKVLKLRKGVKIMLVIIGLALLVIFSNMQFDNAINSCVEGGNSVSFCESSL